MPAPVLRASISFVKEVDYQMVGRLSKLSGQSISGICGTIISEYLREHYFKLHDFYLSTNHLLDSSPEDPEQPKPEISS